MYAIEHTDIEGKRHYEETNVGVYNTTEKALKRAHERARQFASNLNNMNEGECNWLVKSVRYGEELVGYTIGDHGPNGISYNGGRYTMKWLVFAIEVK